MLDAGRQRCGTISVENKGSVAPVQAEVVHDNRFALTNALPSSPASCGVPTTS